MSVGDIISLIWPLIVVQLAFQVYALYDLFKTKKGKTKNLTGVFWAIIIIFGEIIGAALYFMLGRSEE